MMRPETNKLQYTVHCTVYSVHWDREHRRKCQERLVKGRKATEKRFTSTEIKTTKNILGSKFTHYNFVMKELKSRSVELKISGEQK